LGEQKNRGPVNLNAIGSWEATTGLAEAARRVTSSLIHVGVNVALENYDSGAPKSKGRRPADFLGLPLGRIYDLDLIFINLNEMLTMPDPYLDAHPSYKIGCWYWELLNVPPVFQEQFSRVDEIWVASNFVRDTFIQYTDRPVIVFPAIVEVDDKRTLTKSDFGISENRCTYLFHFDANSTFARKNPWAVIDAFRSAFSEEERHTSVQLVIKSINLDAHPEGKALLESEIDSVNGILLEAELRKDQMMDLIGCCDIYVSLHRAEGFGLGMAEAMSLGLPVIATAYSGNMDFTKLSNSCQVGYALRGITIQELEFNEGTEGTYVPGLLWAEPDVEQAARWMRILFESPELRARLGAAGRTFVHSELSPKSVGQKMRDRLEIIIRAHS
jgi:glycosyltransferase involved in cell wall biosynthesis